MSRDGGGAVDGRGAGWPGGPPEVGRRLALLPSPAGASTAPAVSVHARSMALHTVLTPDQLVEAARRFGLPPPDCVQPEPRGRSNTSYHLQVGADRWFLRLAEGKTEADVAFEAEVMRFLAEAHFPVPRLVLALDGRPWTEVAGRPAMLFAFVPGEAVDRAGAGPDRCRRVGEQLGRLHELSAGFTGERENPYGPACVAGWLAEIPGPARPRRRGQGRAAAAAGGAGRGRTAAGRPPRAVPRRPLHQQRALGRRPGQLRPRLGDGLHRPVRLRPGRRHRRLVLHRPSLAGAGGACGVLFSAHPNWTNMMVREALMMTASKYSAPDNDYGWGIMDLSRALYYHPAGDIVFAHRPMITAAAGQPINIAVNISGGSGIDEAQLYWRNGDTGDFTESAMTANGSDFTATIPGQAGSQIQYYFKATDTNNSFAYFPLGGEMHPLKVGLDAVQYTESFDDGINSWISGGTNNTWGLSAKYTRTGPLSLTDSPSGNYLDNTDSWIKSNVVLDLSHASTAAFSFYWRGVLQTGRDSLLIEASTDDANWNRFPQAISGSGFSFAQITCDLTPYLGQSDVRVRFRLKTDASTVREGIYIDDVAFSWTSTSIDESPITTPRLFSLGQNFPNPFNPSTQIEFSLSSRERVELSIYDMLGRKIRTLINTEIEPGQHSIIWDGANDSGQDVASGVYLYKLSAGDASDVRRMTLLR